MDSNENLQIETFQLGKRMIDSALHLDEHLANLLKLEIYRLKKLQKSNDQLEDISKTNQLIRNIIFTLTINHEKIHQGINLCMSVEKKKN